MKKDSRFDKIRSSFLKFFGFWFYQGITVWVVLLASIIYFTLGPYKFTLISLIGLAIWIFGFYFESLADHQKWKFMNNQKNKGKFITSGLWKYSRHPNYFGEFTMWLGIYIYTLSTFNINSVIFGAISPLYILMMLLFVSGIPLLEKSYEKKYGKNKEWKEHKRKTNVFFPWFPKR